MAKIDDKKKIVIAMLVTIIIAFLFLRQKEEPVKEQKKEKTRQTEEKQIEAKNSNFGSPSDYGIVIFKEYQQPANQDEWNEFFGKKVKELKSRFSQEKWDKVQEKIAEDPKKTKEKIEKINKKLKKYRKVLKKNPFDQKSKEKIQQLMILKAIANKLPDRTRLAPPARE
ncbi:MAG: hypothetical protein K9L71_03575 [Candidatus Omnitrophica bacterium]|nr:hypothetical protein [Candidatus Omnitrophota bacterium]